ncbi:unnamed protein product [Gemmata massiliana]|uniref:Uncharacterized protein n=1 Tax=Gemmata massiliana TaxID=1210884 RepID=A0A6P2DFB6_9BACT|nr:hypothetical protein [Gemmata massiliana]VTS00384.1 unnamed protein product [Gemmata massiliana]
MNPLTHARALDVAAPTASYLAERLRGDLLQRSAPELHQELTLIILTALLAFTETGIVSHRT